MAGARRIDPKEVSAEEALGYKKPAHRAAEGLTLGQRVRQGIRQTFGGGKPGVEKPATPVIPEKKKKKPLGGAGSAHVDKYKDIMP